MDLQDSGLYNKTAQHLEELQRLLDKVNREIYKDEVI